MSLGENEINLEEDIKEENFQKRESDVIIQDELNRSGTFKIELLMII